MRNLVNSRIHGVLDYALAALFLLAPAMFRLDYPAGPLAYITVASAARGGVVRSAGPVTQPTEIALQDRTRALAKPAWPLRA